MNPLRDLFVPIAKRPHKAFEALRTSSVHGDARRLIEDLASTMGDADGNFLKDFQSDGFRRGSSRSRALPGYLNRDSTSTGAMTAQTS